MNNPKACTVSLKVYQSMIICSFGRNLTYKTDINLAWLGETRSEYQGFNLILFLLKYYIQGITKAYSLFFSEPLTSHSWAVGFQGG